MYIKKLEIKGFGKLSNLTLDLGKGFNIVFGENESGKSSVQNFIAGMFYGLKGGRTSSDGTPPPLKKFRPWLGGSYGGTLEYVLDSSELYRIERDFNGSSVRVYDSLFNDITDTFDMSREKGVRFSERHLGLNEACFDKTVFIRQMECRIDENGNRELLARLMNTAQTGFEDVSLKKAQEALKDALKSHVGTGRTSTRPLDKISARLRELEGLRSRKSEKLDSISDIENELCNVNTECRKLESCRQVLSKVKDLFETRKNLYYSEQLQSELNEILVQVKTNNVQLDKLQKQLGDLEASENKYDGLPVHGTEEIEEKIMRLNKELSSLNGDCGRVDPESLNSELKELRGRIRSEDFKLLGSVVLTVLFFTAGLFYIPLRMSTFVAAAVSLALAVFFTANRFKLSGKLEALTIRRRSLLVSSGSIRQEIMQKRKALKSLLDAAGVETVEDFFKHKEHRTALSYTAQRYSDLRRILLQYYKKASDLLGTAIDSEENLIDTIEHTKKTTAGIGRILESGLDRLEELFVEDVYFSFSYEALKEKLSGMDFQKLKPLIDSDFENICDRLNSIRLKIKELETRLGGLDTDIEGLQEIDEEMAELEEKKLKLEDLDASLKIAFDVLTEASHELQKDFVPALNDSMSGIVSRMTGGRYSDLRASSQLLLNTVPPETGDVTALPLLSGGTVDQMYLALRLAVAELLMSSGESLPIIMDEVFSQYDDIRTRDTFEFLKVLTEKNQVIFFTCKSRELEIAGQVFGSSLNAIRLNV